MVEGNINLQGGVLEIRLGGLTPAAGQSFDLLDWKGALTGTFSSVILPPPDPGLEWNDLLLYLQGVLSIQSTSLPGDFNHDNKVDAADYVVWRKNPDGDLTPNDYNIWRTNFGRPFGGGAALPSAVPLPAAPEPASIALAFATIVAILSNRLSLTAIGPNST